MDERANHLETGEIKVVCYADDAVIKSGNEDDLQVLFKSYHTKAKAFNVQVSTNKTLSSPKNQRDAKTKQYLCPLTT